MVGATSATCIPALAAMKAARKATSVLPKPTSPHTSRSIGRPEARSATADSDGLVCLELAGNQEVVHLHLASENNEIVPREGARVLRLDTQGLAGAVAHIIHKLHLSQVLLIPVAKWRNVFDAVAFSLADNEDWQAVDTAATVELNSRDPLLCEPGDFHTIDALIGALLNDADRPEQGLHVTTTAAPVMVQLVPDGAIRISVGNAVLADEVAETFGL